MSREGESSASRSNVAEEIKESDKFLPVANVSRIMKNALPKHAMISNDAKDCMQECVSEFISFITSEACDMCIGQKRRTLNGDDIVWAMSSLGFDNFADVMKDYLVNYREGQKMEKVAVDLPVPPPESL